MRRASLLLLFACIGCHGEIIAETDKVCSGALDDGPIVLAEGLEDGLLLADGDDLIHVERYQPALVRRIDGCSGAVEELGAFERAEDAVIYAGFIYAHHIDETDHHLARLPLTGGEAEHLTAVTDIDDMVAYDGGLFIFGRSEADDEHRWLHKLNDDTHELELVLDVDTQDGFAEYTAVAASEAGVYFSPSYYDCGCTPRLLLWPPGGDDLTGLDGTAGARGLSLVGDSFVVARDINPSGFGSGQYEIARLPLDGGEGEVMVEYQEQLAPYAQVVASEELACWLNWQGPPSCIRPGRSYIHEMDSDRLAQSLLVMGQAAYWLREELDGAQYELVAKAP